MFTKGLTKVAISESWALRHMSSGISSRTGASVKAVKRGLVNNMGVKKEGLRVAAHQAQELFPKGSYVAKTANVLTAKARKSIKEDNFALPGRRYPIENKAHARNALSRVAQNGTPEEQATVRAAVHKKYPGMGKTAGSAIVGVAGRSAGKVTKHVGKYRKDYLMGGAAAGSLGTAYGANHKKDK